ncbi:hypothetical protein ARMGADRAFT_1027263 [Armillaria gallica]|uniref:DUF6534 domain-containing protein n=1 Tax=Armillaria gallica TaxID=47427 RepID=A0A2H3DUV6_ARMGA|nr:hypothetical protein ARMGADRAFT_1027263 [Armillaria gallica]
MGLDSTYGSAFIGLIAASILYGVTLTQTYIYFRSQFCDRTSFVPLFKVERRHLITNFSDVSSLDHLTWSMNAQTGFNGLIALIVECIFARRVYIRAVFDDPVKHNAHSLPVSRNVFIATTIVLFSGFHFGTVLFWRLGIPHLLKTPQHVAVFVVKSFRLGSMEGFQELIWVTSAGNGSSAAADILIAASLCFYLHINRTGHRKTDSLITALIAYSLATGLVSRRKMLNYRDSLREKAARSSDTTFPQLSTFRAASAGTLHPPARALSKRPLTTQSLTPLMIDVRSSTVTKTEGSAMTPIGSACSDVTSFSELV